MSELYMMATISDRNQTRRLVQLVVMAVRMVRRHPARKVRRLVQTCSGKAASWEKAVWNLP